MNVRVRIAKIVFGILFQMQRGPDAGDFRVCRCRRGDGLVAPTRCISPRQNGNIRVGVCIKIAVCTGEPLGVVNNFVGSIENAVFRTGHQAGAFNTFVKDLQGLWVNAANVDAHVLQLAAADCINAIIGIVQFNKIPGGNSKR